MEAFLAADTFELVIDRTHPYAAAVSGTSGRPARLGIYP